MLTIIYAKDCNKAEAWAVAHRDAENTIFVRDEYQFVIKDIEPCDQVLLFEESAKVRKAYRPEKIKLFIDEEEKQINAGEGSASYKWPNFNTRVESAFVDQLRVADIKYYLDLMGVEYNSSSNKKTLSSLLNASK